MSNKSFWSLFGYNSNGLTSASALVKKLPDDVRVYPENNRIYINSNAEIYYQIDNNSYLKFDKDNYMIHKHENRKRKGQTYRIHLPEGTYAIHRILVDCFLLKENDKPYLRAKDDNYLNLDLNNYEYYGERYEYIESVCPVCGNKYTHNKSLYSFDKCPACVRKERKEEVFDKKHPIKDWRLYLMSILIDKNEYETLDMYNLGYFNLDELEDIIYEEADGFAKNGRFIIEGIGNRRTLQAIGDDLAITRERVRQIKDKCLFKLRNSKYLIRYYV